MSFPAVLYKEPKLVRLSNGNRLREPAYELAYYGYVEWTTHANPAEPPAFDMEVDQWAQVAADWFTERIGIPKEALATDLYYTEPFVPSVPFAPVRRCQLHFYSVAAGHLRVFRNWHQMGEAGNGWTPERPCRHCGSVGGHREHCPGLGAMPSDSADALRYLTSSLLQRSEYGRVNFADLTGVNPVARGVPPTLIDLRVLDPADRSPAAEALRAERRARVLPDAAFRSPPELPCPRCGGTGKVPEHDGPCGSCMMDIFPVLTVRTGN